MDIDRDRKIEFGSYTEMSCKVFLRRSKLQAIDKKKRENTLTLKTVGIAVPSASGYSDFQVIHGKLEPIVNRSRGMYRLTTIRTPICGQFYSSLDMRTMSKDANLHKHSEKTPHSLAQLEHYLGNYQCCSIGYLWHKLHIGW